MGKWHNRREAKSVKNWQSEVAQNLKWYKIIHGRRSTVAESKGRKMNVCDGAKSEMAKNITSKVHQHRQGNGDSSRWRKS